MFFFSFVSGVFQIINTKKEESFGKETKKSGRAQAFYYQAYPITAYETFVGFYQP